jgi:hypothetical protein
MGETKILFCKVKPLNLRGSKSLLVGVVLGRYIAVPDGMSCSGVKYVI